METIETLIPDNEGNHLVIVLYFYDEADKSGTFMIPQEFVELDIADININKLDLNRPVVPHAFFKMCDWLTEQLLLYPNAVFSFICSTDSLKTHHSDIPSELYRWNLFESLRKRHLNKLDSLNIKSKDIIVGPDGYQTYARVFYRDRHSPVIHLVIDHLASKYS